MPVEPYLFLNGRCEEAIAFYQQAAGARLEVVMRFNEMPETCPEGILPPDWGPKIMHASLDFHGARVMMSDSNEGESPVFKGFALSLALADETTVRSVFAGLANGGQVVMPLEKTFWSPCFGMVTDRFGVLWQVSTPAEAVPV